MNIETVIFNVGGQKFEVSKHLLLPYPNTILGRLSTNYGAEEKTNGFLFRYVLKYLRNRKVYLPPSVSKDEFLAEMAYYGFEDVDGANIDDGREKRMVENREASLAALFEKDCECLASYLIYMHQRWGKKVVRVGCDSNYEMFRKFQTCLRGNNALANQIITKFLNKAGYTMKGSLACPYAGGQVGFKAPGIMNITLESLRRTY